MPLSKLKAMVETQAPIWFEEYGLSSFTALSQAREVYRRRAEGLVQLNILLPEDLRDKVHAKCVVDKSSVSDFVRKWLVKGVRAK
jgi:hypothetical protein